ncbi:MAG TPA: hypothetical protein PKD64_02395 [Pirellulaceae bacterium]|nr:hypothetical protein [Pirellulaceae bacterium]
MPALFGICRRLFFCVILVLSPVLCAKAANVVDDMLENSDTDTDQDHDFSFNPVSTSWTSLQFETWNIDQNKPGAISELMRRHRTWSNHSGGPFIHYNVLARSFYINDQRIRFTGNESTFAVEAQLDFRVQHQIDDWNVGLVSEIYLSQPFDENLLVDYGLRESFRHNFLLDPLELSELYIHFDRGPWRFKIGRFETPFGRYWAPFYLNSRRDVPFIRSESILFRETGIQCDFKSGHWILTSALTNGGLNRDTNSGKAFLGRIGFDHPDFVIGSSLKWHDGISSEGQKEFNRHAGFDIMRRLNDRWLVSGEVIYDEYGMRRPGFNLDDIFWGRSIYNRQINRGLNIPLNGVGYYANLIWEQPGRLAAIGYGEFYPTAVGDPIHDQVTRRVNTSYHHGFNDHLSTYCSLILENSVSESQNGEQRRGFSLIVGMQFLW